MTQAMDYSPWGKLKRRLEQAAQRRLEKNASGRVIVGVRILMNADGAPLQWTEPDITSIEPANRADVLNILAGDNICEP